MEYWFDTQSRFVIYGSSMFFVFDTTLWRCPELIIIVWLIDFAHVVSFPSPTTVWTTSTSTVYKYKPNPNVDDKHTIQIVSW